LQIDNDSVATFLNNQLGHYALPQIIRKTPWLPITLFSSSHLGMSGVSGDDRSQGIVSTAEGVLRNLRGCHGLTCGVRSKNAASFLSPRGRRHEREEMLRLYQPS
jgi:hypothetical protein